MDLATRHVIKPTVEWTNRHVIKPVQEWFVPPKLPQPTARDMAQTEPPIQVGKYLLKFISTHFSKVRLIIFDLMNFLHNLQSCFFLMRLTLPRLKAFSLITEEKRKFFDILKIFQKHHFP
jgi:hypothetical protein